MNCFVIGIVEGSDDTRLFGLQSGSRKTTAQGGVRFRARLKLILNPIGVSRTDELF